MTQSTNPIHQPEASEAEEDTFEVWFEQYRMQSWLSAGCDKDRGPQPSEAWGLGSRQSLLRGWLARAALAATQPPSPPAQVGTSGASAEAPEYSPVWVDKTPGCAPMYYGIDKSGESCRISPNEHLHSVRLGAKIGEPAPAAKVGTEEADAQAKALTYEEIAAAGLGLEYVHSVLRWTACGYVHTPERIASLHTSYRIVDRIINAKAAPQPPEAMAPAAPVAAVGEAERAAGVDAAEVEALAQKAMSVAREYGLMRATDEEVETAIDNLAVIALRALAAPRPRSSPLTEAQAVRALDECFTPDDERTSTAEEIAHSRAFCVAIVRAVEAAHGIVPDPYLQTR